MLYIYIYIYIYITNIYIHNIYKQPIYIYTHTYVKFVPKCIIFKTIRKFAIVNANFDSYCSFCLFGSYIAHFLLLFHYFFNFQIGFFHETLVDQNFGKAKFWQNYVIWTYIQTSDFCSIFGRDRTTQPSQKAYNLYIYICILEEHFIGYHILFTKHQKLFLFLRNRPFSNTTIFADVSKN